MKTKDQKKVHAPNARKDTWRLQHSIPAGCKVRLRFQLLAPDSWILSFRECPERLMKTKEQEECLRQTPGKMRGALTSEAAGVQERS